MAKLYYKDDRVLVKAGRSSWVPATVVTGDGRYLRYLTDRDRDRAPNNTSWTPRVFNTRAFVLPLDSPEAKAILDAQAERKRQQEEKERRDAARREVIKAHPHNGVAQRIEDIQSEYRYGAIERRERLLELLNEVLPAALHPEETKR